MAPVIGHLKQDCLSKTKNQKDELKNIKAELEQLNSRLTKARDLLLSGDLDGADYKKLNPNLSGKSPIWKERL